jgi:hypothetical protein
VWPWKVKRELAEKLAVKRAKDEAARKEAEAKEAAAAGDDTIVINQDLPDGVLEKVFAEMFPPEKEETAQERRRKKRPHSKKAKLKVT